MKMQTDAFCGALTLVCLSALLSTSVAHAQAGAPPQAAPPQAALPLGRFDPSWAGDRFFGTAAPNVTGHLVPSAKVDVEYVHNPFVLRRRVGDDT